MFRSQQRKTRILFGLADAVLTAAAFEFAYRVRAWLPFQQRFFLQPETRILLLGFTVAAWAMIGYWHNISAHLDSAGVRGILRDSARQVFWGALALMALLTFGNLLTIPLSRVFLLLFLLATWVLLAGFRLTARKILPRINREFAPERRVLIVGAGERAIALARKLETYADRGVRIEGFLAPPAAKNPPASIRLDRDYPVRPVAMLPAMLSMHVVDEIHFAVEAAELAELEEVFLRCDEEGVCTRIALDFFPHVNSEAALEKLSGTPLLTFSAAPDDAVLLFVKRAIDVVVSTTALIALSPLLALTALLIRVTSAGPVVFRQLRCGLNGRTFICYKFRSMVADAEQRLHEVAHLNPKEIVTKIPNDPRLTPVGRWLRKFSIDELPQLINVLRGDMSLVGPRPAIPGEVAQYKRWQRRRLRMRPGLTCLWAVEGRDRVDFESWMRLDMQYIDNWSLGLDARIMLRTIPHVLSGRAS